MNAPLDIITEAVLRELAHAMAKYPTWPTDPLHAVAVLGEEFGELTKAVLQHTYEPHKADRVDVRLEAIQTAAMALRFALSLDGYVYAPGEQHAQELHLGADQPQSRTDAPCESTAPSSTVEGSDDRPLAFSRHFLKTVQPYFDQVMAGVKTFEVRLNDRGFRVGDVLVLQEWDAALEQFTGRETNRKVTHVLDGGKFGVDPAYVVMSIAAVELPPLPEGWRRLDDGHSWVGFYLGAYSDWKEDGCPVLATALGVVVDNMGVLDVADLITVLRHAEREHVRLKTGGGQ